MHAVTFTSYVAILVHCFHFVHSSVPQVIRINPIGPGYVRVEWTTPQDETISGHQILYTQDSSLPDRNWEKIRVHGPGTMTVLKGLTDGGKYFFKIKAVFDGNMIGPASVTYEYVTTSLLSSVLCALPFVCSGEDANELMPKITLIEKASHPSVAYVHWSRPDYLDGKLLEYQLHYGTAPLNKDGKAKVVVNKATYYGKFEEVNKYLVKVKDLKDSAQYEFMVRIITEGNPKGFASNIYTFKTKAEKWSRNDNPAMNFINFMLEIPLIPWTDWLKIIIVLLPLGVLVAVKKSSSSIWTNNSSFFQPFSYSHEAQNLYRKATNFYERERYLEALITFKALSQLNTDQFELDEMYLKMAVCCESLGDLIECLKYSSQAVHYNVNNMEALLLKGKTLTSLGRFVEAFTVYWIVYLKEPTPENAKRLSDAEVRANHGRKQEENNNNDEKKPELELTYAECLRELNLLDGATKAQIREAYLRETRIYHPDKNTGATESKRRQLNEKTMRIRLAYRRLNART